METKVVISKKLQRILKLSAKMPGAVADSTILSDEEINELNTVPVPNNAIVRRILHKIPKHVKTETFIIPVDEGVITGYFYEPYGDSRRHVSSLRPLIIYYHGGGWVFGNMEMQNYFCAHLAAVTESVVLSVDYRLAPQHKFPVAVEDCYNSLLWAAQGARYWRIDPDRIFLLGASSGANLAAVVSRLARDRRGPELAGQILIYPVTDGRMRTSSYVTFKDSPTLTAKAMTFFITSYQREPKDILNPNFSPLLAKDHSRLPPTLIVTAEYDPLLDDGKLYAEALTSADTPVRYLECKETVHGYLKFPHAPGSKETEGAIMQFINGKPLEQIELMTIKALQKLNRLEKKRARQEKRQLIEVQIES